MYLLEVREIRVLYGKAIALNELTVNLKPKEMVGVMGPNGAGKSTLLRAISGVVPVKGEIRFKGERIDHRVPHEIVRMGIVHCPERRQLFVDFTVDENLEMGAFLRRDKPKVKQDLNGIYDLFPILKQRKSQLAGTLSGGEQQMLAIGRSLMSSPQLLLLDEPSMGLSPFVKQVLMDAIRNIWETGLSILIVEQDASLTLDLTERVYILDHGKVAMEGRSKELIDNEEVKKVYFQMA